MRRKTLILHIFGSFSSRKWVKSYNRQGDWNSNQTNYQTSQSNSSKGSREVRQHLK
jgi:hypothetical protein